MRAITLLLVGTLSLSLSGCVFIADGSGSMLKSDGPGRHHGPHGPNCQCGQHGSKPSIFGKRESSRPPRKTRPLFAGDRWNDHQHPGLNYANCCPPAPCECGGCGDCHSCMMPPIIGPDCSAPPLAWTADPSCSGPVWSGDPTCSGPAWTGDPNCSAPAIPQPNFMPHDPGCQAPFGLPHAAPMPYEHGPGCNCGQHGHPGPQGPHGPHGPQMHPHPGSSVPGPHHQPPAPQHFTAPGEPVRPMPVPPAENPVPMPMPMPAPENPAPPVEQTSWEIPALPPLQ